MGKTKKKTQKGTTVLLSDLNIKTEVHIDATKAMYLAIETLNNCAKATEKAIESIGKLAKIQITALNVKTNREDKCVVSHAVVENSVGNTIGMAYDSTGAFHQDKN